MYNGIKRLVCDNVDLHAGFFAAPDGEGAVGGDAHVWHGLLIHKGVEAFHSALLVAAGKGDQLGGEGDVPGLAAENIKKLYPNIKIVGYSEGFFKERSEEDVIKELKEIGKRLGQKSKNIILHYNHRKKLSGGKQ